MLVDRADLVVTDIVALRGHRHWPQDSSIVDQDVDPAEHAFRVGDDTAPVGGARNILRKEAAITADLCCERAARILAEVCHNDLGSLARENSGRESPHAASSSGDDRDFAV